MTCVVAATRSGLVRASCSGAAAWSVEPVLAADVRCLAADPDVVYAGTQESGVLRSDDGGATWMLAGLGGCTVKSLAVSRDGAVHAGARPARVHVSHDGGESWSELAPFSRLRSWWWFSPAERPFKAYVGAVAVSPDDPDVVLAGIELGGVFRSEDRGRSWSGHRPGASRDCHALLVQDGWAYQAGGTRGGTVSRDGGRSWTTLPGLDRRYGWSVAADPAKQEVSYLSAAFARTARGPGCDAAIFRSDGSRWERLAGGLPEGISSLPILRAGAPGEVYAAMGDGELWASADHGGTWRQLPVDLGGRVRAFLVL